MHVTRHSISRDTDPKMASFILLLGLCSLTIANPVVSITDDVTANVTADVTINNSANSYVPQGAGYIGCYREATGVRALGRATLTHPRLTVGVCEDFCSGYRFCMIDARQPLFSYDGPP